MATDLNQSPWQNKKNQNIEFCNLKAILFEFNLVINVSAKVCKSLKQHTIYLYLNKVKQSKAHREN